MPASCSPPATSTRPSRACRRAAPRSSRNQPNSPTGSATAPSATRQALVPRRRLRRTTADEHDSLLSQPRLNCRPVDETGLDLLLDPDLHQPRLGMVRTDALLRSAGGRADAVDVEHAVAVAMPAG